VDGIHIQAPLSEVAGYLCLHSPEILSLSRDGKVERVWFEILRVVLLEAFAMKPIFG